MPLDSLINGIDKMGIDELRTLLNKSLLSNKVSIQISHTMDVYEAIEMSLRGIVDGFGFESAEVFRHKSSKDVLDPIRGYNKDGFYTPKEFELTHEFSEQVMKPSYVPGTDNKQVTIPLVAEGKYRGELVIKDNKPIPNHNFFHILHAYAERMAGAVYGGLQHRKVIKMNDELKRSLPTFSHDIRSPMNVVKGFTEILLDMTGEDMRKAYSSLQQSVDSMKGILSVAQGLNEEQKSALEKNVVDQEAAMEQIYGCIQQQEDSVKRIARNADYATSIVSDIMDFFELESASSYEKGRKAVDVSYIVDEIVGSLEPQASKKELKVENNVPGNIIVEANESLIRRLYTNLIENAVKYTPEGNSVEIGLDGDNFYVRNTGVSIPEDEREHIFKPFFRTTEAKKSKTKGSGLGTSIIKNSVRLLGGKVNVEGDNYTQFTFNIPYKKG